MTDPNSEAVRERLQGLGFSVTTIDVEAGAKRPDLVAEKDGAKMYVEVKTRTEDAAYRAALEAVSPGATQQVLTSLNSNNSLSSAIARASQQLVNRWA